MLQITALELNFLIFRYLEGSGFKHSAFNLGCEAGLSDCPLDRNMVPPQALVKCIQKGIQYLEMEANLSDRENDLDEDFSIIRPLDLITKDVDELKQMIMERRKDRQKHVIKVINRQHEAKSWRSARRNQDNVEEHEKCRQPTQNSGRKNEDSGKGHKKHRNQISTADDELKQSEDHTDTNMVTAHEDNAFVKGKQIEIFGGELKGTLRKHKEATVSIKWNRKGGYVLTGSLDTTAIVWDVKTNDLIQHFELHSGQVLDIDWRNDVSFAASTEKLIHVCKIGTNCPVKTFPGHQDEVNSVSWDPTGSLLASSSDDTTVKIWSLKQDNYIHDFREHRKEVLISRWSPTGQGTSNPNKQLVLASASFDSTVKMWDVEQGKLICNFNGHRDAVYSIAFSPDGEYLASGSMENSLNIWSVKTGKIVKSYAGKGIIFEVCWNKEGDKVAACNNRNHVFVLDFRM